MAEAPPKPAAPPAKPAPKGSYAVLPEKCVGCDACARDFPDLFEMVEPPGGERKAIVKAAPKGVEKLNARAVVKTCPTDAITYSAELPPAVGGKEALLQEAPEWQAKWEARRHEPEEPVETARRYGRDFTVEEREGYLLLTIRFPTLLPPWRDVFRYGLPEAIPYYATRCEVSGSRLVVRAWLTDPRIRTALCFGATPFPDRFSAALDAGRPTFGFRAHYDAKQVMEVVLFLDRKVAETFHWPAHYIFEACTGCTVCARVCPTNAITGEQKKMHYIDPKLCINCSVCGVYCPFDAIKDPHDEIVKRIMPREIPKAKVIEELCTGCEFCIHVCPFDALKLSPLPGADPLDPVKIAEVIEKNCVSCKLCEQVCIKGAIVVPRAQEWTTEIGWSFQPGAVEGVP